MVFADLEDLIVEVGDIERELDVVVQSSSVRAEEVARLTARVMALGASVQKVALNPLVQDPANATAFKDFTARFKSCLVTLQSLARIPTEAAPAAAPSQPADGDVGTPSHLTSRSSPPMTPIF